MTALHVCRKVPGRNSKARAKPLILLAAKSLLALRLQSPAKPRKAQYFQGCKVQQGCHCKVHPYGGRPGVPPPVGSGPPPWCFGVAGKADFKDRMSLRWRRLEYLIGPYAVRCFDA